VTPSHTGRDAVHVYCIGFITHIFSKNCVAGANRPGCSNYLTDSGMFNRPGGLGGLCNSVMATIPEARARVCAVMKKGATRAGWRSFQPTSGPACRSVRSTR